MKRKPKFEKAGCFFRQGDGQRGFHLFNEFAVKDNDIFVYNKGILWKLRQAEERGRGLEKSQNERGKLIENEKFVFV